MKKLLVTYPTFMAMLIGASTGLAFYAVVLACMLELSADHAMLYDFWTDSRFGFLMAFGLSVGCMVFIQCLRYVRDVQETRLDHELGLYPRWNYKDYLWTPFAVALPTLAAACFHLAVTRDLWHSDPGLLGVLGLFALTGACVMAAVEATVDVRAD